MSFRFFALIPLASLAACSGSSAPPQTVTGRIDGASFKSPVSAVRASRAGSVVEAPVSADGSFSITIPAGTGYRIELVAASGQPGLVFPRSAGTIDVSFDVRAGTKPFDLGLVRFVGDANAHPFVFKTTGGSDGDGECEDGVDPNGAVCVDDNDDEGASCDNHECVDGIDPSNGQECDGGPGANQDDGETADEGDGDGETDDDALPAEAAIAEHNLPAAVGCDDGDGETNDDAEGQD
jgi:hypothetical protein